MLSSTTVPFGRQTAGGSTGQTIQNINNQLLTMQGSPRKLQNDQLPGVLTSKRSIPSNIPKEEIGNYQSLGQKDVMIKNVVPQEVRQTPPFGTNHHQPLQQIHQLAQSPFLKTPASKVYAPPMIELQQQSNRMQKLQLRPPTLLDHISKRKQPASIVPMNTHSQFPSKPVPSAPYLNSMLSSRQVSPNQGYNAMQRPISIASRRF